MQKAIIAGAFAIAVVTSALFAAGGDKMKITSSAFQEGGDIPSKFSREAGNVNPPLRIDGTPENAKSLVLIVDDPDAPVGCSRIGWFGTSIPNKPRFPKRACQRSRAGHLIIRILVTAGHSHPQAPIVIISKSSLDQNPRSFVPVRNGKNSRSSDERPHHRAGPN
jgi:phosphatidylethanolamine-binding protein (PEBP) family uncharacterized protein